MGSLQNWLNQPLAEAISEVSGFQDVLQV
jgi:hypothetical protein